jgi:hypothetical protein
MFLIFILEFKGQYQQVLSFPIRIDSMSKKRETNVFWFLKECFKKDIYKYPFLLEKKEGRAPWKAYLNSVSFYAHRLLEKREGREREPHKFWIHC